MTDRPTQAGSIASGVDNFIRQFCILPEAAYLPLALWAIATHTSDAFDAFPYIALLSPMKRCGKTRVLEVLELLCAKPRFITTVSPASLFRMMEESPTLLLDEVEALRNSKPSETAQAILAILNAGHRKGATVTRCEPTERDWKVRYFRVYGPKAFAAIGRLPDTLADRCICLPMQRKTTTQNVARFLRAKAPIEAAPIFDSVATWAEMRRDAVCTAYEGIGDIGFLTDREADLWMPIFAVCTVAAPDRMDELKRDARILSGAKAVDDAEDSNTLRLLVDVRAVWPVGSSSMTTESLLKLMNGLPDGLWSHYGSGGLTPIELAKMLRPFGIHPRTVRIVNGTAKGYQYVELEEAFSRYLPCTGHEAVTSVTTRINTEENGYVQPVTSSICDGQRIMLKPA